MERLLQRLVSCLAFAAALLAPSWARATLLPACDAHDQLLTRGPVIEWAMPTVLDGSDVCDAGSPNPSDAPTAGQAAAEDVGDSRVPAMCDERGASMIAPPRILPMTDARIMATPGCANDGGSPLASAPGSHRAPVPSASAALAEHAVLDARPTVPPPGSELAPSFPPVLGGARSGHPRGIEYPPR